MNEQKLIFFDVDDTLIHHRGDKSYIPNSTKRAISDLKVAGHIVAIASARGYMQIGRIMSMLGIEHAVCFNGHMMVVNNEVVYDKPLHKEDAEKLIINLKSCNKPMILMDQKVGYIEDTHGHVRKTFVEEVKEVEGAEGDAYMNLLQPFEERKQPYYWMMFFWEGFKNNGEYTNLSFKKWHGMGYEVSNAGMSKLSGIYWMANHFGIHHNHIVVFGDNYNDIEMLKGIKHSVAMGNAVESAKEAAAYVTDHVGDHGIEKACRKLGLIK